MERSASATRQTNITARLNLSHPSMVTAPTRRAWLRFTLVLVLLLAALLPIKPPAHHGDAVEYSLTTMALANHGTPDIRLADIAAARPLVPNVAPVYQILENDMQAGKRDVYGAFERGREGRVYAVHFFAYPAMAAPPFKLLRRLGLPPYIAYQLVNLGMVLVLGLSLFRLFGSASKALLGVLLFMLCGGVLYWDWGSPECMSAAALLAALVYFNSGAPRAAGVLAGLASLQNPTIVLFFGFAPLLHACLHYDRQRGWRASLHALLQPRYVTGIALGLGLFSLPVLFNLWQYGVPNIIAKRFPDASLIGLVRLHSFLFDLNQGMIIGIPAVLAATVWLAWRLAPAQGGTARRLLLPLCCVFTVSLGLPALSIINWNSAAAGVMRYGFWAAMPLLYALLWQLRSVAVWPRTLVLGVATVVVAQAGAMAHALSYDYVHFSPLAKWVMTHAPGLVNPEPEIFAERSRHNDDYLQVGEVYRIAANGMTVKTLVNLANPDLDRALCDDGRMAPQPSRDADRQRGWRYLNGPVACSNVGADQRRVFRLAQFLSARQLQLDAGWSKPQAGGGAWDGVWSDGAQSDISLAAVGIRPQALLIRGMYYGNNKRTRIVINGVDMGWYRLDREEPIVLPPALSASALLTIELRHEEPSTPGAHDARYLAVFLQRLELR